MGIILKIIPLITVIYLTNLKQSRNKKASSTMNLCVEETERAIFHPTYKQVLFSEQLYL